MPIPINPYIAGNPIKDERAFFGRQDVFDWVSKELRNLGTNALVLFGQRRIGKTSLLLQLKRNLPSDDYLTVYFDLQDTSALPLGRLLANLADAVVERANLQLPPKTKFDNNGNSFQQQFVPWILEQIGKNKRLVFLLDEFDVLDGTKAAELPPRSASKSLLPFLRSLMNNEPRLAFVFVLGRHPADLRADFSATFKASLSFQLWVLDQLSAIQLIHLADRNDTLRYESSAVDRILQLTNRHPYLTQLFCQRLWEYAHTTPTIEIPHVSVKDVNAIILQVIETGSNALDWLWRGLQPAERIYAAALAEVSENQFVTDKQVRALLSIFSARLPIREVELAPSDLVQRRVIEVLDDRFASEKTYRFAIELFRLWVKENQPLSRVKDDLDRVDEIADQLFNVAYSYYQKNEWQSAYDNFDKALQRNPRHFKATLYLGETWFELGHLSKAMEAFQKAYILDPQAARQPLARAWLQTAEHRLQEGDTDSALQACAEALILSPNDKIAQDLRVSILVKHGDKFLEKRDWAIALVAYQKAGAIEKINQLKALGLPRHEWLAAGENALSRQDKDAALLAYEYAGEFNIVDTIRKNPDLITACHAISSLFKEKHELEQAKIYLYKIIGLDPENVINSLFSIIREQLLLFENRVDKLNSSNYKLIFSLYQETIELQSLAEIILPTDDTAKYKKLGDKQQLWNEAQDKNINLKDFMTEDDYKLLSEFVGALQVEIVSKLKSVNTMPESKSEHVNDDMMPSEEKTLPHFVSSNMSSGNTVKVANSDTQLIIQYAQEEICLVKIEPGIVLINSDLNQSISAHQSTIKLNYPYWIGKYPITNQQYSLFAKQHNFEKSDSSKPVTKISWPVAIKYCEWLEEELRRYSRKDALIVRLPDEVEWERAAKGDSKNSYPWGDEPVNDSLCNYGNKNTGVTDVGIYSPLGNSLFGCSDMAGNVWEWTVSPFDEKEIYHPGNDFDKTFTKRLVCKGGAWSFPKQYTKCSSRYKFLPNSIHDYIGFRILITKRT